MIEGLDGLLAALDSLQEEIDDPSVLKPGAFLLLEGMKRRVAIDTGELRDSLQLEVNIDGVTFSTDSDHAEANEFGTHDMAAKPFIRPTFDTDGPKAIDAIANEIRKRMPHD